MKRICTLMILTFLMLSVASCVNRKENQEKLKILCVTEDGRNLSGASFQICTDRSCSVFSADERGILLLDPVWKGALVHTVPPSGYVCAGDKSFTLEAEEQRVVFRRK